MASFEPINKRVYRKLPNLRFYDYNFSQMSYFNKDMKVKEVEVNRLDNQILVCYFDEEWGKVQ
jgi:spermidine synthase